MTRAGPKLAIDISLASALWGDAADTSVLIERTLQQALAVCGAKLRPGTEVSILLCDDEIIAELNARYRNCAGPTNVLSFPTGGDVGKIPVLGDIVIAYETTSREAEAENKSFAEHFTHLLVHGFLHLLGYDHGTDAEAEAMENMERHILAALGIADPYRCVPVETAETM
jgi:probable rRNA maturation factor